MKNNTKKKNIALNNESKKRNQVKQKQKEKKKRSKTVKMGYCVSFSVTDEEKTYGGRQQRKREWRNKNEMRWDEMHRTSTENVFVYKFNV